MKKFGKTKNKQDNKETRKIRLRNRAAQNLLENFRQFGEKKIPNKKNKISKFNKHKVMKESYLDEDLE